MKWTTLMVAALVAAVAAGCGGGSFDAEGLEQIEAWAEQARTVGSDAVGDLALTVTGGEPVRELSWHVERIEETLELRGEAPSPAEVREWEFSRQVSGETFFVDGPDLDERLAALELSLGDLAFAAAALDPAWGDADPADLRYLDSAAQGFMDAAEAYRDLMFPS